MKKLKDLRLQKKLTQLEVAEYLGISQQAYANYEAARREPDIGNLIKLAELFNVSVDILLGLEDEYRLNTNEKELLNLFRKLDNRKQIKFLGKAEIIIDSMM
mgnify:FL=1